MPPARKPARLWLRPERARGGKVVAQATWLILDGGKHFPTGCLEADVALAEQRLAAHNIQKYQPKRRLRDIEDISVADALAIYLKDRGPAIEAMDAIGFRRMKGRIGRLNDYFGRMVLADINGESCRGYVAHRGRTGGARRDLEDLRAAIGHHQDEGLHRGTVKVKLPRKGEPRMRWLTRSEAAKLLITCWRYKETQTAHRGAKTGEEIETKKRPLRHLARFILIGLYTGTRAGAIASASWVRGTGRSYVDLEEGVFYRLAEGKVRSNKRQPPVRLPSHLLAHLRRWSTTPRRDGTMPEYVVEWNGKPVASVKTAFASAVKRAELADAASPHVLRHTAATWLMQEGASIWEAAGFLGMTPKILSEVYGHHHPDHQAEVAKTLKNRRKRPVPLVKSLVKRSERGKET